MNKQKVTDLQKRILDIELQRKVCDITREKRNYSRTELNIIAKASGIKYYRKYNKFELAEKLGIELPGLKSKLKRVYSRFVEILNLDGTTTTYPSMTQAARALGIFSAQIYTMIAKGEGKFL